MLIGLDARTIYRPARRGTGKNLIDLYRHLAVVRPDWQVLAYHRQPGAVETLLPKKTVEPTMIEMVGDRFDAWQRWRLPLAAWQDQVSLLHCPANTCPAWMPVPTVVTIHDLIPLDMPQGRSAAQVRRFVRSVTTACKHAAWIICPSQYTHDRLVAQFDADPNRMTINPWAADSSIRQVSDEKKAEVLRRYGIDHSYVLHFGSGVPRKNTRRVIEAWAMLRPTLRRECQLVIVGLDEQALKRFATTVEQFAIEDSVRLYGFADESDLPALLAGSRLLAYPSLSEGFGLPILDAWAAGICVLTSDVTSLPEVAGDAALLVDPTDPCSIARGLSRLLRDMCLRAELMQRSAKRLKRYSWRLTAERFAVALEEAVGVAGLRKLRVAA